MAAIRDVVRQQRTNAMPLTAKEEREIAGALRDVDPAQIAVTRRLKPAQRVQQGLSMIRVAENVVAYRTRARFPGLSRGKAMGIARSTSMSGKEEAVTDPEQEFGSFVRQVLDALEEAGIKYLVGGAVAVWGWGEARTTRDFDVVVDLPVEQMARLSEALRDRDMLVPPDLMLDIYLSAADLPINAIHLPTGYKLAIFLRRPGDALRASALERRLIVDFGPEIGEAYVHSPEDLILYKLQVYRLSGQPKHIRDIGSIIAMVGEESLEQTYLAHWIDGLELGEIWMEIGKRLGRPGG